VQKKSSSMGLSAAQLPAQCLVTKTVHPALRASMGALHQRAQHGLQKEVLARGRASISLLAALLQLTAERFVLLLQAENLSQVCMPP
jgi:hypothetical protein